MPVSEKQKKAQAKYDKENMEILATKARKETIRELKQYAQKNGMSASKFALKAMIYCKENNINFKEQK